ncbi:sugar ABC transporter permease [Paenibacillus sp. MY03]|jgi:putative aldouronate transport system permease protein|uniref:carbohydrate ABC transporter permease n=1 Tax=Paenibacillus sp. MY03 TaxID=302980 RepID=UPI000B3D093C|nr:carbohydrate ABC transporter permease [Paenibacillus sp. MY03]OUS74975.1 sugar ABC transporter permease [Paenibacillus sp. MY03]
MNIAKKRIRPAKIAIHLFFIVLTIVFVLPLALVVSTSLSSEESLLQHGYSFFPHEFSLFAFEYLFKAPQALLNAYGVTILITVIGAASGLLLTAMIAYAISRRDYKLARPLTFYVFFTMLFSGGLVPWYILISQYLHLKDTIWALILPMMVSPFNIIVMKGFMAKIPMEIIESGKMDGAREWQIFFRIIMPLSTPALATIGLLISFTYWNDWYLGLLFINNDNLVPLQLLLIRMMNSIDFIKNMDVSMSMSININDFPDLSVRMAMVMLAAGPMLFVFPFFQKYFVQGLTVGSLKG